MVLLYSLAIGVAMVFGYDIFLAMRRAVRHAGIVIFLQDFLFLAVCTLAVFILFYQNTSGVIRGYAIAGMIFGMIVYKKTLSPYLVFIMSTVMKKTIHLVSSVFLILFRPAKHAFKGVSKVSKSGAKIAKKGSLFCLRRLTVCIKLSRIKLCKQSVKKCRSNRSKSRTEEEYDKKSIS